MKYKIYPKHKKYKKYIKYGKNTKNHKYPQIDDLNFYKKINKIYHKYTIPPKKKTFREICFSKKIQLQKPQGFLAQFMAPDTPYKGIMIYHKIGSGKTLTAIMIAEEWKRYKKIMVLLPASLKGNFRDELRSKFTGNEYLTDTERKKLKTLHPTSQEYLDIIAESDKRINKYYIIYSYNKFTLLAQEKKINLKNTILIIDEIQNMVSEEGTFYHVLHEQIEKSPNDIKIILLSATPMFDKPNEIALTLNLLKPDKGRILPTGKLFNKEFIDITINKKGTYKYSLKNMDIFRELIKGKISYYRGAPLNVFPKRNIKFVKCVMSDFQYSAYKDVLKNEENRNHILKFKNDANNILSVKNLPNDFFIGSRFVSNVVFPNRKINQIGFDSFNDKYITEDLEKYSTKFAKILKKIREPNSGKIFVYSNFKEFAGIKSFTKVLEAFGYKNYNVFGEGLKRFAVFSGDETNEKKEEIKAVYNQKANIYGNKLKILLLTPAAQAGISLTCVKQAHILEPTWNWSKMMQIIGRGSRFCSHKNLPKNERFINIYIYQAVINKNNNSEAEETIDQYISKLAKKKHKLITLFEKIIIEMAIDCTLNKNANIFAKEEDIICAK